MPDSPERSIADTPPITLERLHGGGSVLEARKEHAWESRVVLNPAAILVEPGAELGQLSDAWGLDRYDAERLHRAGGACVLLYRAQGEKSAVTDHAASSIGLAVLTPRLELVWRRATPVLTADQPYHNLGVEDPRCTKVGDLYYLYYTGYSATGGGAEVDRRVRICLATTRDFLEWDLHGPVVGDINEVDNKNAALFPEPVKGKWMLLHRPMAGPGAMAIHLAESNNPEGPWTSRGELMRSHVYREFERSWIGAGGPPVALGAQRFIMIYHQGHFTAEGTREYDLAAALLDFSSESIVRSRIEPILRPTAAGERTGDQELGVDNVVFTCANYRFGDELVVPYAGADSRVFGASATFEKLVAALEFVMQEQQ